MEQARWPEAVHPFLALRKGRRLSRCKWQTIVTRRDELTGGAAILDLGTMLVIAMGPSVALLALGSDGTPPNCVDAEAI